MELKIRICLRLLVFLAQSGPARLSEWILRAKMEPKESQWEAKLCPMMLIVASEKEAHHCITV